MKSLWYFNLLKLYTKTITDNKHYQVKINLSHYAAILPKSQKCLKLVSSLHIRGKNELEIFVISHTNIWSYSILILPRITKKQSKV